MDKALGVQIVGETAGADPAAGLAVAAVRPTISACCQAILGYFAIDPATALEGHGLRGEVRFGEIRHSAGHLAMTLLLPMPFGQGEMMVGTIGSASVTLPGLSLSPEIRAAAIGQPVGRLTGHPAFAELDHLLVSAIEESCDANGRRATVLRFDDMAEPFYSSDRCTSRRSLH